MRNILKILNHHKNQENINLDNLKLKLITLLKI